MQVRRGFTLIELLVVIAVIAILAAILFPVFAQARSKARQATAISNQKQMAMAFMMYAQDFDETLPFLTWYDSFNNIGVGENYGNGWYFHGAIGWPVSLVPYHKNDTRNGNKNSFLISPGDTQFGNFSKPEFKLMLKAVNWPRWQEFSEDAINNARIFPLSFCANYNLSYSHTQNPDGTWTARTAYTGPRSLASIVSPANVVLVTEYGVGDAWGNGRTYSNYYCSLGYGGVDRWRNGRRYFDGRTFSFTDGHVKFYRDPVFIERLTGGNLQEQVQEAYARINVFDIPDRSTP
jgi:prepilin-type N-terminal cleavage/methylation domain-containing protein